MNSAAKDRHTCAILDTSAVMRANLASLGSRMPLFASQKTLKELMSSKRSLEVELWLRAGRLRVIGVSKETRVVARALSRKTGDLKGLSDVDLDVIALAIELKDKGEAPLVFTCDYAIQNVLSLMGIGFKPIGLKPIRRTVSWQYLCPVCGKRYELEDNCPVCGSRLVKRARRTSNPNLGPS